MKKILSLLLLSLSIVLHAQSNQEVAQQYALESMEEFKTLLRLKNDANHKADLIPNIEWCKKTFGALGFSLSELPTPTLPLLLAEKVYDTQYPTILVYLQLDGQPVDFSQWNQESPWKPVLKRQDDSGAWKEILWATLTQDFNPNDRIFARATSDAKGPVMMLVNALRILEAQKATPSFNLKLIMDFEEELGSPNLPEAVLQNKEALEAEALIIFDGPLHESGEPTLKFGARGIATLTLTAYGPIVAQHSGHYGNYAPNPALLMSRVLASMKDAQGRVVIPGYYDGIRLAPEVLQTLKKVPDDETAMKDRMQFKTPDAVAASYQESLQYPSLNIRGIQAGWTGSKVRTIIPPTCVAEIDIRLVKESDPKRLLQLIRSHIEQQGVTVLDHTPTKEERLQYDNIMSFSSTISYEAFRTDFETPVGHWLSKAIQKTFGKEPIKVRTTGGSIPISPFVNTLGIPAVCVPTVNLDNNQHSPNENLRIGNYVKGIQTFLGILTSPYLTN